MWSAPPPHHPTLNPIVSTPLPTPIVYYIIVLACLVEIITIMIG